MALDVADVDLAARAIRVRSREGKPRSTRSARVPIGDDLAEILAGWVGRTGSVHLFPGLTRRGRWKRSPVPGYHGAPLDELQAAARAAGLDPGITFEKLHRFYLENRSAGINLGLASSARPESASSPEPALPTIRFGALGSPIYIGGTKVKKPLTEAQHAIVSVLLDAGPEGLTGGQIAERTDFTGWRETLRRLKESDPLWDAIIVFPGISHGRYRIAAVRL